MRRRIKKFFENRLNSPNPIPARSPRPFLGVLAGSFPPKSNHRPQNKIPAPLFFGFLASTGVRRGEREREVAGDGGGDDLPHPARELHVPLQPPHRARGARQLHHRPERKYASQTLIPPPSLAPSSLLSRFLAGPLTIDALSPPPRRRRRRREKRHPHGPMRRLRLPRQEYPARRIAQGLHQNRLQVASAPFPFPPFF